MKIVIFLAILSLAGQAQANELACWRSDDPTKKVVVYMAFNQNGSANFDGDGLTATGSYKESDSPCPTRLCGQWSIGATFNKVIDKSADFYADHISVDLRDDSIGPVTAYVGVYDFNGRAPITVNMNCNEK